MSVYYNEIEPYAAQWLRNLIAKGLIADGEVDTRSIVNVQSDDLRGFKQCHFFAGVGGWSYAARLAGWPDDRPLWTGSAPCQPFSTAGRQKGTEDERHLWPIFFELIRACRPDVLMGEQVAAAVGKDWLDGVCADLEGVGYACGATVVPACAVDAPHRRDRLWFVAHTDMSHGERGGVSSRVHEEHNFANSRSIHSHMADSVRLGRQGSRTVGRPSDSAQSFDRETNNVVGAGAGFWSGYRWAIGADGKARRVEPSIRLLAHGVPARVGRLRAYGNAIVPQVAAEVIAAFMESRP